MKRAASTLEVVTFSALLVAAGAFVVAVRARANWDQDIWWHLRAGQWIADHASVPATDPFSQYGHGKTWIAYSWLFDITAYAAHHAFGLTGLVLLTAGVAVLIAAGLYVLLRGLGAPLVVAAPLTLVGVDAMMPLMTPRPWLFSMLFFLIEVHLIATAMKGRTAHPVLCLLPVVFILWANVHVQFVIGLVVLAAAAADAFWYSLAPAPADLDPPSVPWTKWLLVGVVCAAAALANPYHVRVYEAARELMGQTDLWTRIGELLAPDFRRSTDWVILALVVAAAVSIGWQSRNRPVRAFLLLLFALGIYLGFRSRRDTWLTVTTAACVIAAAQGAARPRSADAPGFPGWLATIVAMSAATLVVIVGRPLLSEDQLEAHVGRTYPVAAADFIDKRAPQGPLYNYYDWGGYLMWRLPRLPVHMDGRTLVHGEPRIVQHVDTWQGKPGWLDNPELAAAKIVIGPRDLPLASLLRLDERFTLVYEDRDGPAVVFEARARK